VPASRPQRPAAYVIAGGGALTLLAFFAMPLVTVPIFGSLTGAGVAELSAQIGALGWLWLVPLSALAVAGIGAWQSLAADIPAQQRRTTSMTVTAAAGLVVLIYLIAIVAVQSEISDAGGSRYGVSAGSILGAGFWIAMLAMIAAGAAAVVDLRSPAR
jgi:hypothetical protein